MNRISNQEKISPAKSKDDNTVRPLILIVDDDKGLLQLLSMRLQAAGYRTACATSGEQALEMMENISPSVVITDLKMGGMSGLDLLQEIHLARPVLPIIILTAHGTIPDAIVAAEKGVFAFLTKPIDKQELLSTLEQACKVSPANIGSGKPWGQNILTRSAKMFEILEQAKLVANSDVSVLIYGESGTGKELIAEAIHKASQRRNATFLPVNCAAIPAELLESELFGYHKGAFTGAVKDYEGLFMSANGGTLFLDEIGDMPLPLQVKLLRVLQEEKVRPLGAVEQKAIDVRVITATHRHLEQLIKTNEFREDLYYRLNVVSLQLPPLRERKEDIPLLLSHFLDVFAAKNNQPVKSFSKEAVQLAMHYHWPGNVRQLKNWVEKAVTLSPSRVIPASLLSSGINIERSSFLSLTQAKQDFERKYVIQLLRLADGNVPEAARLAGRNRSDFYKILKKHNIDLSLYHSDGEPNQGEK